MSLPLQTIKPGDWLTVNRNFGKIKTNLLGGGASPTFAWLTLTGLTASRLIATNGSKGLVSSDLYGWVTQTTNQVLIADDADGTITFSTPQNIHSAAVPTFAGAILSGTTAIGLDMSSGTFATNAINCGVGSILTTGTATIGGNVDTVQLAVKQEAGQTTNNILELQDSSGVMQFGFYSDPTVFKGIGLVWAGGSKLIEQTNPPHGTNRMLYFPVGDRFEVLTEDGSEFICGYHGIASSLPDRVILYRGVVINAGHGGSFKTFTPPSGGLIAEGAMGIGETDPETLTEWTGTAPYLTIHNNTHEDSDGGRESRLIFKGEQSGGEETALFQFEVSHDGSSDDTLGKIVASVNTGAGLVQALGIGSDLLATFAGNIVIPDAGYMGGASFPTAMQIASNGEVDFFGGFNVIKDGAQSQVRVSVASDVEVTTGALVFRKSDGSHASPALVDDNAVIGKILFQGHDGSGFHEGARIETRIDGTPSDGTDMPMEMTFWTAPDDSATDVQRYAITPDGYHRFGPYSTDVDATRMHFAGQDSSPAAAGDSQTAIARFSTFVDAALGGVLDIGISPANAGAWFQMSNKANHATNYPILFNPNGGNVGIQTATPTLPLSALEKSGMTPIGGFAIKLTNKTGGNSVAGQLVAVYSATAIDDAVKTAAGSDDGVIGITLDAGIADGSEMWVVVSGFANVLMDGGGSARGDRIISSGTAGSADVWNTGGAVATHFQEIGHCVETRTGAGLARCVLHFN